MQLGLAPTQVTQLRNIQERFPTLHLHFRHNELECKHSRVDW
jgi:hypothetical protein